MPYSYGDYSTVASTTSASANGDMYVTIPCNFEYEVDSITGDRLFVAGNGEYLTVRHDISNATSAYNISYVSSIEESTNNLTYGSSIIGDYMKNYRYFETIHKTQDTYSYYLSGAAMNPEWAKSVKRESLRQKIRNNLAPSRAYSNCIGRPESEEESRARNLLRSLIGEERYQLYLKRGFVIEQGKSGMKYKVKPGHGMVIVLHPTKQGKFFKFRSLCIQPKVSGLPPTDAVIMRILLIRHDEFAMQKLANVTALATPSAEDERGVSEPLKQKVA